jgi:hypothetical protein
VAETKKVPYAEYEKLARERDLAAYRAVGCLNVAISYLERIAHDRDAKEALRILKSARDRYEAADAKLKAVEIELSQ